MATTVTIDSVTTGDAAPVTAPFRISAKATKSTATVKFTPTHDGLLFPSTALAPEEQEAIIPEGPPRKILGYRLRLGGASYATGVDLGHRGEVCGEEVCSEARVCSEWDSPSGVQLTEVIDYAETGTLADGDYAVNLYVNTDGQGWA